MSDNINPVVILVQPQLADNVGMVARAMLNCGVEELRLVSPITSWPNERAMVTSANSLGLLPEVQVFDSLEKASQDLQYLYASTARPRNFNMDVMSPIEAAIDMSKRTNINQQKIGIVFGKESSGLDNDDISKCNMIVTVPLNDKFTSLNLSQAVLLLLWEWRRANVENLKPAKLELYSPVASKENITHMLGRLEYELDIRGFFKSETARSVVKRNLRSMFNRITMNEQELKMFYGIIRTLANFKIKK